MYKTRLGAAALLSALLLPGCAGRYGHSMIQSAVSVSTVPPGRTYYVVPVTDLDGLVPLGGRDIKVDQASRLQAYLASQISDRANGGKFIHAVGTYALVVQCADFYRIWNIRIEEGVNAINRSCEGT